MVLLLLSVVTFPVLLSPDGVIHRIAADGKLLRSRIAVPTERGRVEGLPLFADVSSFVVRRNGQVIRAGRVILKSDGQLAVSRSDLLPRGVAEVVAFDRNLHTFAVRTSSDFRVLCRSGGRWRSTVLERDRLDQYSVSAGFDRSGKYLFYVKMDRAGVNSSVGKMRLLKVRPRLSELKTGLPNQSGLVHTTSSGWLVDAEYQGYRVTLDVSRSSVQRTELPLEGGIIVPPVLEGQFAIYANGLVMYRGKSVGMPNERLNLFTMRHWPGVGIVYLDTKGAVLYVNERAVGLPPSLHGSAILVPQVTEQ